MGFGVNTMVDTLKGKTSLSNLDDQDYCKSGDNRKIKLNTSSKETVKAIQITVSDRKFNFSPDQPLFTSFFPKLIITPLKGLNLLELDVLCPKLFEENIEYTEDINHQDRAGDGEIEVLIKQYFQDRGIFIWNFWNNMITRVISMAIIDHSNDLGSIIKWFVEHFNIGSNRLTKLEKLIVNKLKSPYYVTSNEKYFIHPLIVPFFESIQEFKGDDTLESLIMEFNRQCYTITCHGSCTGLHELKIKYPKDCIGNEFLSLISKRNLYDKFPRSVMIDDMLIIPASRANLSLGLIKPSFLWQPENHYVKEDELIDLDLLTSWFKTKKSAPMDDNVFMLSSIAAGEKINLTTRADFKPQRSIVREMRSELAKIDVLVDRNQDLPDEYYYLDTSTHKKFIKSVIHNLGTFSTNGLYISANGIGMLNLIEYCFKEIVTVIRRETMVVIKHQNHIINQYLSSDNTGNFGLYSPRDSIALRMKEPKDVIADVMSVNSSSGLFLSNGFVFPDSSPREFRLVRGCGSE